MVTPEIPLIVLDMLDQQVFSWLETFVVHELTTTFFLFV